MDRQRISKSRPEQNSHERLWLFDVKPEKVYVAASMAEISQAVKLALLLTDAGLKVTSRWLRHDFSDKPDETHSRDYYRYEQDWGEKDLSDVYQADTLVVLNPQRSSLGGTHVEFGYFTALGRKNLLVVGDRPNVFYYSNEVRFTKTLDPVVEFLTLSGHGPINLQK